MLLLPQTATTNGYRQQIQMQEHTQNSFLPLTADHRSRLPPGGRAAEQAVRLHHERSHRRSRDARHRHRTDYVQLHDRLVLFHVPDMDARRVCAGEHQEGAGEQVFHVLQLQRLALILTHQKRRSYDTAVAAAKGRFKRPQIYLFFFKLRVGPT